MLWCQTCAKRVPNVFLPCTTGAELLTSYEENSAAFWSPIRCNLAQYTYVNTQDKALQVCLVW